MANFATNNKQNNRRTVINSRNTQEVTRATNRALNKLEAKIASLNMAKGPTRGKNRARSSRMGKGETSANIPLQMAYTQRQATGSTAHTFRYSDMIGSIAVSQDTPVGQVTEYLLNPLQLAGSKIKNLALNFEKFQFSRAKLSIGVNMPTNISGTYVVGYCENPDQTFTSGTDAPRQVYALRDAVNKPWWQRADVNASFSDRKKKYNIDYDSDEIMQTTQGKFVIANISAPTVAGSPTPLGTINVPVFLDYTVTLYGSAIQNAPTSGSAVIWPAGTFTSTGIEGTYEFVSAPGEVPPVALDLSSPYQANPAFVLTAPGDDEDIAVFIARKATLPDKFCFYETIDDFRKGNFYKYPVGNVQVLPRTTVQLAN